MTREEAIENVRSFIGQLTEDCQASIRSLVPELQESEDERIRKELWDYFHDLQLRSDADFSLSFTIDDILAYLEKQKDASKAIEAVERIDKYIDAHTANAHDMDDSNPDKKYYQGQDDALGKIAGILQDIYSEEKQKEQREATPETCLKGIFDFDDISQLELAVDCYKEKKGRAYPVTVKHQHKVLMKLYDLIGIDREALDQDEEDETD